MCTRTIEKHSEESFSGIENARQFVAKMERHANTRFRAFLSEIKKLSIPGDYLEIGAGAGSLAIMVAKDHPEVNITAIEISADMTTIANETIRQNHLESRIRFITGDIEDPRSIESLGKYDVIYSAYSLHHWKNPVTVIGNLLRLLKDDGALIICDLRRIWWLYWIPKDNGFYNSIRAAYTPREIASTVTSLGIRDYRIRIRPPFFIQNLVLKKNNPSIPAINK